MGACPHVSTWLQGQEQQLQNGSRLGPSEGADLIGLGGGGGFCRFDRSLDVF